MEETNIRLEYGKLKKKYKDLPDFDSINNEFEVECVEDCFTLRNVRRKMVEKLDFYAGILEEVLNPESSLKNMYECRFFSDKEKDDIYSIFKRISFLIRYSAEVSVLCDEKDDVEFIKKAFDEWSDIKPSLSKTLSKVKGCWEKETELKEDLGYFG